MKTTLSFNTRINFAMSYKNYDPLDLVKELRTKGININRYNISSWIEGLSVPKDSVIKILSKILLDDENKIYDDDFIECIMAFRNGDRPVTNKQFREAIDHAYTLKKRYKESDTLDTDDESELFQAVK